jgi:cysteinyl-tRNA synthetase
MNLRLYNTLTRQKEDFVPIDASNVRMYVCGPTVYDFAHIGNARPVIVFDVLYRLLRHIYGEKAVTYVRNITDVDDKINARALRDFPELPLNDAIARVTAKTADQFQADAKALGCLEPTMQPRATDNIKQMIDMISTLINKGHAYEASGEVLFSVGSMKDYGGLSNRKLDEQQAGARVAVEAHKKNPADFVLWKLSSAEEPGWESPWGRGRPGWHIECSAMSKRYLGEVFDIHGGGLDLIFPHHENEIAQSRCAHGTSVMANVWMHNGFLQVEGQKMSKSLGNFVTIAELFEGWRGHPWNGYWCRLAMLKSHYTQPLDWTAERLGSARNELNKLYAAAGHFLESLEELPEGTLSQEFIDAVSDDLNTPDAIAILHKLADQALAGDRSAAMEIAGALNFLNLYDKNRPLASLGGYYTRGLSPEQDWSTRNLGERLNIAVLLNNSFMKRDIEQDLSKHGVHPIYDEPRSGGRVTFASNGEFNVESNIQQLISKRLAARHTKNWEESDRIRDVLDGMGIAIKDNKDGTTTWEVKR